MEWVFFTEMGSFGLATFAIVFGMGKTFWDGYRAGHCLLPGVMIKLVNIPMSAAVCLRATTLILADDIYWFLVAIDAAAFLILFGTTLQYFGLFRRTEP